MLSRMRLLTQFLRAWHPIFLAVAIPNRPIPWSVVSLKCAVETLFPSLKTSSNRALDSPELRGDLVTTLDSASLEGVLAIGCSHSDPEAVSLAPVAIIWLVGPFHGFKSSLLD